MHTLGDLDRARAVGAIHRTGISLRKLALELNCSRSLLSRLLQVAKAPPEDLAAAREGTTSTRELARRAGSAGTRGTAQHHEAIAFELERAGVQGSQTFLSWLDEEGVAAADRAQVIEQACFYLAATDHAADEQENMLAHMLLVEVGSHFRRRQVETDRDDAFVWPALMLALCAVHRISDGRVRTKALELARGGLLPFVGQAGFGAEESIRLIAVPSGSTA